MYAVNIPVAYTRPGQGPKPFQQPESMGKRRQASPAPFDLEANDIYLSRARGSAAAAEEL